MVKTNIIISPSGQLYGSENVLLDFLEGSNKAYEIYAPKDSLFHRKLKSNKYKAKGFVNLKWLYLKLILRLLFTKKSIYLNEAGHISYIKLLAKLLPFRKFVVSVRLLEDCNCKLKKIPKNITLIPVSYYLKNQISTNGKVKVVYDPYKLSNENSSYKVKCATTGQFVIGIVGRIVETKGLNALIDILKKLEGAAKDEILIIFFGDFDFSTDWFINFKIELDSIKGFGYEFAGYKESQNEIYSTCDLILHLNKVEALGRIIFESIDYETPFLCYKAGGTGELAGVLGFSKNTVEPGPNSADIFKIKILEVMNHKASYDFASSKKKISQNFSLNSYANQIEKYL